MQHGISQERLEAKLGIPAFLQRIVAEIELEDGDNVSTHLGPEDGSTHLTMIRKDPPCITTEEFLKTIVPASYGNSRLFPDSNFTLFC